MCRPRQNIAGSDPSYNHSMPFPADVSLTHEFCDSRSQLLEMALTGGQGIVLHRNVDVRLQLSETVDETTDSREVRPDDG